MVLIELFFNYVMIKKIFQQKNSYSRTLALKQIGLDCVISFSSKGPYPIK